MQGDIVAVYNASGTKLISYTYDAWGNFTTTYSNGGASTSAIYNPFRYRSYYYDTELGLYYLNSRYYDSNTGRFINADDASYLGTGEFISYNLFAYCYNNPISMTDDGGTWPNWLGKAIVVSVVAITIVAVAATAVITCGASSVAGVAAISGVITMGAKTAEVAILQKRKSESEDKNETDIVGDVFEAVYDNGLDIIGITPATKAGGIVKEHYVVSGGVKAMLSTPLLKTLKSPMPSKFLSYAFAALAVGNMLDTLRSDDPMVRAKDRGIILN